MAKRYTTDEVVAMMSAPSPNVEMLEQPASPFLDPAQINAAERELSQPPPEYPRPDNVGAAISDAAGIDRPPAGSSGNMALQNYEAQEAFPIDQTPAPQRPAGGSQTLYPSAEETKPALPRQRYTTDEVMSLYMQQSKPRYSTKDVMLKMVQPLDDPTMPRLGRDEYFKAKEIKKSLQESGDLPSNWEETKTAVGGFLLTVPDAFATALYKTDKSQGWFELGGAGFNPALALSETWRRSPATLAYSAEMARQGYAGMAEGLRVMGGPKYRVAESGEFVMDDEESAGGQFGQMDPRNIVDRYKAKGLTLRPVNDEDKKDFEYQQWNKKMDRDLQVERARTAEMPPEFAYRMLVGSAAAVSDYNTGRNDFANITGNVGPMQSQAVVGSMLVDPLTYTTFGAAATRIGISAAAKGATARSLDIIGRAVNKAVKPAEVPLTQIDRFRKIVMPPAKVAGAYGLATGAAYAADVMQLPPELKTAAYTAAGLYTAYRGGLGVLRFVGKSFPEASVILRESADPTNGLDIAARKVVATNPNVPSNVRARLERPSQFLSMESTPQRLSQNMALSPGTRKVMEKLSNWYVVQGVRGASDVATGAVKGTIVAAPFAELTRLGGDERAADAMYGIGPALGALGGAANRVFGARGRTIGRAESDIGRMLVDVQAGNKELRSKIGADGKAALQSWNFYNTEIGRMLTDVELAAGDVDALVKNRSFDELARIAAMQGFFRSKVDYIPLGAADFALNADQHGADGSAGFFLSVPDSERARIFVNVDARRADVEPHEFGEAFFSTGAFSPEQMAAMRSGVDARYGLDGVQKRANEYAESLISASNATNFPNEKLVISAEQIQAKVNELAQAELQRGGNDPLDWVRREIMVEEWRMAGMDFASIRRNIPEGANPVKFIEDVLGANARALGLSGVRVDPETGIPITPEQLFRENPVAADDPVVMSNLKAYTQAYRAWLNDPAHEVPSGVKIAPDGRAESLANNPNVIFDANGQNPLATRDPQTGQVRWKNDKDRAKDAKVRGQQIRNVAGRDLVAPGSPQFGPKKTANGRIRISGRRLPAALELQNHWKPQLDKIRRLEALADGDESTQVLYVAMGNSADKVKTSRPQDIVAINREMVFDEWVVQGKNNDLYGQFLDLTTIRNRAMRAISERNPALDPARGGPGYSLQAVMDDVYQWMADKRANKDGGATIGADRKNVVNALINPGTNLNREKNPIAGAFGRGSAIKTLLVDNIMAVSGTGRKGAAMDYNWANGNFMPDKPAPRPNMDGDLTPDNNNRMPSALPQAGMAMPDAAVTQDGLVQAPEDAPKFKLPRQAMAQFMPDTGVNLADYADRTILALPADRMGIGNMMVGPKGKEREVSVKGQGGAGFMEIYNGGGWAFSDEATGNRFMKRLREAAEPGEGSVLVGITAMSEFNHLKNQTGQLAYVEALEAAIDGKSISKKQADAHIKAISQSIMQSTAKSVTDSTRRKFAAIKNFNDFSKAVRNKSLNFADAAPYSVQIARKALPIPYKEAKDIGIAFDDIGKQTADPRYANVPFGTVVALLEVPLEQAPVRSDFHYSYPFKVTGRSIGFLKQYYDVGQLTSDPRIRNSAGAVQAQPLQTVLPKLDQTRKVTRGQAMPDVADAPPFYLKSSQALDAKVQGKAATADQIKAILTNPQNGIKAEELKWTGVMQEVERLAKENNGKVPKEALLRYLAEDGAVRLEEVTLGAFQDREWKMRDQAKQDLINNGIANPTEAQITTQLEEFWPEYDDGGRDTGTYARYEQYQLPGGENYREVVLAMPNPISGKSKQITDKYGIPYETSSAYLLQQAGATLEEIRQYQSGIEGASFVPTDYRSTHFDTPNYVAHMRLNERVDAKGKQGLFIEELQSDRHQSGRDAGYVGEELPLPQGYRIEKSPIRGFIAYTPNGESLGGRDTTTSAIQSARMHAGLSSGKAQVPDAPFRTSWPLQLFKRALRDAVDSGKEWIGWTTGETQAARYDLSKQIKQASAMKMMSGKYLVYIEGTDGFPLFRNQNGFTDNGQKAFAPDELKEFIGKEAADNLIRGADAVPADRNGARDWYDSTQQDLKVGGEGMKGFYDTMVPKDVAKYVKQWGGQVEKTQITPTINKRVSDMSGAELVQYIERPNEAIPVWRVNITPQMREGIKKAGQALFAAGTAAVVADQEQE